VQAGAPIQQHLQGMQRACTLLSKWTRSQTAITSGRACCTAHALAGRPSSSGRGRATGNLR
jgi:hypothetical protein